MLKFGVLVLLPLVLGLAPPGPRYGTNGGNNQGSNGHRSVFNSGSSGANVNNMNTGSPHPNRPNNRPNNNRPNAIRRFPYNHDVPFYCTLDSDIGYFCPYRYERPSTRYYFNVYSGRCESFYYRGCGGNPNSYSTREECVSSCACFTYADYGNYPCYQPSTYRWYFDKYSGTCQPFFFSGCNGGNDNNFQSQLECQSTCGSRSCYGPWCNGINMMPINMYGAQSPAMNAVGNVAAQSPAIPAQSPQTNAPQNVMPVNVNAPVPNFQNQPMPNGPSNAPMPIGVNMPIPNAPNSLNEPQPEPQFQGVNGMNGFDVHGSMGNNALTSNQNSGNNGVNMNSIAQIWKMASNAMNNADTTSNVMSMAYPTPNQMKPGISMY